MSLMLRQFDGPSAWRSQDYDIEQGDWIDELTPEQRRELHTAARALPIDESQWLNMSGADLDLPTLGPRLDTLNQELEAGRGFVLLRGIDLPPADLDYAYRVNWVLALRLGEVIAQNANGEVIGAVHAIVDADDNGINTRGYVSSAELRFHCDGGDVASLLCVRQAPEGGLSSVVSMVSIHNTMVRECPQHLATLYRGMRVFMRKEGDLESSELPRQPLFFPQGDYILAWINLKLMELPYVSAGQAVPAQERAALDALEEIAERPENKLTFRLQPGNMLLVHNYVCMHKRSRFVDDPDPDKCQLMLRLWYNQRISRVKAIQTPEIRAGYYIQARHVIRHRP